MLVIANLNLPVQPEPRNRMPDHVMIRLDTPLGHSLFLFLVLKARNRPSSVDTFCSETNEKSGWMREQVEVGGSVQ